MLDHNVIGIVVALEIFHDFVVMEWYEMLHFYSIFQELFCKKKYQIFVNFFPQMKWYDKETFTRSTFLIFVFY